MSNDACYLHFTRLSLASIQTGSTNTGLLERIEHISFVQILWYKGGKKCYTADCSDHLHPRQIHISICSIRMRVALVAMQQVMDLDEQDTSLVILLF